MQTVQRGCCSSMQASTSCHSALCAPRFLAGRQHLFSPAQSKRCSRGQLPVVAVKGKRAKQMQQMQPGGAQGLPTPEIDPSNVEFVIFISPIQFPQWYPLSIVKAGPAANALVRGLDTQWGKLLYGKTLVRNIAKSVYRDKKQIEKSFKQQVDMVRQFSEFKYAFKIRDKKKPKDWYLPEDLTVLPPEDKLGESFLESLRDRFTGGNK